MASVDLLAQRSPATRHRPAYPGLNQAPATPASPHTPLLSRTFSSQFGSPGGHRIEDENVIFEIGSRFLRAGFAGEPVPKFIWQFSPESGRRVGDYSRWTASSRGPNSNVPGDTIADWELWHYDVSNLDLDLVEDRLERALRIAHEKHLLLDIKTRSAIVVLPSALPNPLTELVLKTIFSSNNHPKSICLMSNPVLCTISAGLRSALVVDIGWHEATFTPVFEYREVAQRRSTRAGKRLAYETSLMLSNILKGGAKVLDSRDEVSLQSFSKIEGLVTSLIWCRGKSEQSDADHAQGESTIDLALTAEENVSIPHSSLAEPAEQLFLTANKLHLETDDHDLPLHTLVWKSLLGLSEDVRGVCMSRIVFTGGASNIPGLKGRILDEVRQILQDRGWNPVSPPDRGANGRENQDAAQEMRNPPEMPTTQPTKLNAIAEALGDEAESSNTEGGAQTSQASNVMKGSQAQNGQQPSPPKGDQSFKAHHALMKTRNESVTQERDHDPSQIDEISRKLEKDSLRARPPTTMGKIRAVQCLGAWAGASLMGQLKVESSIEIKRDDFLRQGMNILGYPIH